MGLSTRGRWPQVKKLKSLGPGHFSLIEALPAQGKTARCGFAFLPTSPGYPRGLLARL
jgi:hypothetical protein